MIKGLNWSDVSLLLLRAAISIIFIGHGLQQLFGWFGGLGLKGFSHMLYVFNITPGWFWAWIVIIVEIVGGLLLLAGIFSRISSLLLSIVILTAIMTVHISSGFFGGFEYQFLIFVACLSLALSGPGKVSLLNKW